MPVSGSARHARRIAAGIIAVNANLGRRDRKVNALRAAALLVEAPQTLPELPRQKERSQIVAPLDLVPGCEAPLAETPLATFLLGE